MRVTSGNSDVRFGQPTLSTDARRFTNLAEIARLINRSSDLPAVLNQIVTAVCQHSSWASCGIMRVDRKVGLSQLVVRFDPRLDPATNPPTSWKLEQSATMRVIETNRPVIIRDAQRCKEFLAYKRDAKLRGYHTVVVLPLGTVDSNGREMTIAMHSRDIVDVTDTELAFLSTVTQLASLAVDKAERVQVEQDRTRRLRRISETGTDLMENVLAEQSLEVVVGMVAAVLPYSLIIADLAAGTLHVRRSPAPKVLSDTEWRRIAIKKLGPMVEELVRNAAATGQRTVRALLVDNVNVPELQLIVEPLQVNGEAVGGLIVFPPAEGLDDLDEILIHAARLALDVQLLRDHVRFRAEASSITEVLTVLFAGPPRRPSELIARAKRLGVSLPGPARLVTVGFPNEVMEDFEPRVAGLHLTLARRAADLLPGAAVMLDSDIVIFAPVSPKEDKTGWKAFLRSIETTSENHFGVKPIVAESRICYRLQDYREARLECTRVIALARLFGKTGQLSQGDFGPFALLLSTVEHASAREFVRSTLGAIEEYDRHHATEFLRTLEQFLRFGCRYRACADRMGIHVSTLRYRLDRLHGLFGVDLGEPDSIFGLTLALRLRELETVASP